MTQFEIGLAAVGAAFFLWRRLLTFLHIAQQEEYHPRRILDWWREHWALDRRGTAAVLIAAVLTTVYADGSLWIALSLAAVFVILSRVERDPRTQAKKRLVMTLRATRIHRLAWGLSLFTLVLTAISGAVLSLILAVQLAPFVIIAAIFLLRPVERRVAEKFQREAMEKVRRLNPMVVALTGSFGKTSVKHMLGHLLSAKAPTLITPGSVNSPLGVTRIVREQLTRDHTYFVVEMGAYGVGSIRRVCQITPPDLSMLITVGPAHYERFKSLEEVARAKIEIAEEAVAKGGRFIMPEMLTQYEAAGAFATSHPDATILTGPERRYEFLGARATPVGGEIRMRADQEEVTLVAPIFGAHQAENLFLAAVAALEAGMTLDEVRVAFPSIPQIKHRCEVKRGGSGPTIIDDSYNSNPIGFRAALEVLDAITPQGGRRIVVTPGMVELGALHDKEHRELGAIVARQTDIAVIVRPERVPTLLEGMAAHAPQGHQVREFSSFSAARAWLDDETTAEDVVLIENDLPDLYEMRVSL